MNTASTAMPVALLRQPPGNVDAPRETRLRRDRDAGIAGPTLFVAETLAARPTQHSRQPMGARVQSTTHNKWLMSTSGCAIPFAC